MQLKELLIATTYQVALGKYLKTASVAFGHLAGRGLVTSLRARADWLDKMVAVFGPAACRWHQSYPKCPEPPPREPDVEVLMMPVRVRRFRTAPPQHRPMAATKISVTPLTNACQRLWLLNDKTHYRTYAVRLKRGSGTTMQSQPTRSR